MHGLVSAAAADDDDDDDEVLHKVCADASLCWT
jgi:hypothetical protein